MLIDKPVLGHSGRFIDGHEGRILIPVLGPKSGPYQPDPRAWYP